jgi:hypothetical protein
VNPVLALALLLAAGLAATRLRLPPLRHMTSLAGAPFLVAGLVLGPALDVLDRGALRTLTPITALGIGWIGAVFGAQLEWRLLRRIPGRAWGLAAAQAGVALVLTVLVARLLTRLVPALALVWRPTIPALLTLGAVAVISGPAAVTAVAQALRPSTSLIRSLELAALLDTALGAVVFAFALGLSQPHRTFAGAALGWAHWVAVGTVSVGGVCVLFVWLSRFRGDDTNALGLDVLGAVLVGSGLGYAADLSPFVVCALAMALIVNVSPLRRRVQTLLGLGEPTVYGLFLVAIGAQLDARTLWVVPAVLVLGVIRVATRWAATRYVRGSGLATVAQGAVPLALAMSFNLTYAGSGGSLLTTVLLGVAVAQAVAAPLMALALGRAPVEVS